MITELTQTLKDVLHECIKEEFLKKDLSEFMHYDNVTGNIKIDFRYNQIIDTNEVLERIKNK